MTTDRDAPPTATPANGPAATTPSRGALPDLRAAAQFAAALDPAPCQRRRLVAGRSAGSRLHSGRRTLPMSPQLRAVLAEHGATQRRSIFAVSDLTPGLDRLPRKGLNPPAMAPYQLRQHCRHGS